jgi:ketosteroid isomerase-like protein
VLSPAFYSRHVHEIAHEEIYLDTSGGSRADPVTQWSSPPTSADTIARTRKTAVAFYDAAARSDTSFVLGQLVADDVLFYDTASKREQQGATELLLWWNGRTFVSFEKQPNDALIVGRGWAVVRWIATGAAAATSDTHMPSAAMLETRSGKVVRLTLYYDSATLPLHI